MFKIIYGAMPDKELMTIEQEERQKEKEKKQNENKDE